MCEKGVALGWWAFKPTHDHLLELIGELPPLFWSELNPRGFNRRFRFHDLRHTFGSLLIQDGASLAYVKEQMGHSSIQVTADTYGHLIPGANINWVDGLDRETSSQQNATPAQPEMKKRDEADAWTPELIDYAENSGGPGRIRTYNQQIMSLLL